MLQTDYAEEIKGATIRRAAALRFCARLFGGRRPRGRIRRAVHREFLERRGWPSGQRSDFRATDEGRLSLARNSSRTGAF